MYEYYKYKHKWIPQYTDDRCLMDIEEQWNNALKNWIRWIIDWEAWENSQWYKWGVEAWQMVKADCPVTGPWWKMIFVGSISFCIRGLSFCVITACSRIVHRFAKVEQSCKRWEFVPHNYHQWLGLWNVLFTKTTVLHGFVNFGFSAASAQGSLGTSANK